MAVAKHYGRVSETPRFCGENSQEIRPNRHSVFSTVGCGELDSLYVYIYIYVWLTHHHIDVPCFWNLNTPCVWLKTLILSPRKCLTLIPFFLNIFGVFDVKKRHFGCNLGRFGRTDRLKCLFL